MLGLPILYFKCMRLMMFQLSGFYCRAMRLGGFSGCQVLAEVHGFPASESGGAPVFRHALQMQGDNLAERSSSLKRLRACIDGRFTLALALHQCLVRASICQLCCHTLRDDPSPCPLLGKDASGARGALLSEFQVEKR